MRRHQLQLDKVIFGLATQSSSSSSSSSSEDEEEPLKVEASPTLKRYEKRKVKEQKESLKVETDTEESESKDEVKPVKRKRGRPLSLEKKTSPPKKIVKKPLLIKKTSSENTVEKRPRGRPRKVSEPVSTDNIPIKHLKTKVKSPKENINASEGINKTSKSVSPLKTKSPAKENEVDENITSTTERLKDPDVVEDETVSSSCQDLVRSVKVQTKPISKKPPKSYINKVSSIIKYILCIIYYI